ncbi:hypothetical protein M3D92_12865, partial [Micrococcus terreus]|uniref:zinc finger domain-containing protein n=1 Tax=Micrococcus terreus TaxID=574650 RepID=UPI0021A49B65
KGCMAPLNLVKIITEIQAQGASLAGTVKSLSTARNIIEQDRPIARSMSFQDAPWFDPGCSLAPLSPKQILRARQLANTAMPSELVTYRQAIKASRATVPTYIHRERRAKGQAAQEAQEREAKEPLLQALLEDMLTRPCGKCGASAGDYCTTSTGNRAEVLHAARRDASPMMMEHRHLFVEVKQPPAFTPDPGYYRKNRHHDRRRDFSQEKEAINDLTDRLAQSFTPPYDY